MLLVSWIRMKHPILAGLLVIDCKPSLIVCWPNPSTPSLGQLPASHFKPCQCLQELRAATTQQHSSDADGPDGKVDASTFKSAFSAMNSRLEASQAEVAALSQSSSTLQQAMEVISQRTHHTETQLKELMEPTAEHTARLDALALESKEARQQIGQTKEALAASTDMLQQGLDAACLRLTAAEGQVAEMNGSQRQQIEAHLQSLVSKLDQCQNRMAATEGIIPELQENTRTAADTRQLHEVTFLSSPSSTSASSRMDP